VTVTGVWKRNVGAMEFLGFVLSFLPPPPARVLEVGCGDEGGLVEALAGAGHEALGIDPEAPAGPHFRRIELEQLEPAERFDAAVASRVLHHVEPLGPALDRLAVHAPLLLVDDFARERIDGPARTWYEARYRELASGVAAPRAPADLGDWRARHPDLHDGRLVLEELRARYDELFFEERPYLYRWLRDDESLRLERELIAAGTIPAIGLRYAGAAKTETDRSPAESR
jgi:hypothetical protein